MSEVDSDTLQNHVPIVTWVMNIQVGDETSHPRSVFLGFFFYFIVFHFAPMPVAASSIL